MRVARSRELVAEGYPLSAVARAARISRQAIYRRLEPNPGNSPGEATRRGGRRGSNFPLVLGRAGLLREGHGLALFLDPRSGILTLVFDGPLCGAPSFSSTGTVGSAQRRLLACLCGGRRTFGVLSVRPSGMRSRKASRLEATSATSKGLRQNSTGRQQADRLSMSLGVHRGLCPRASRASSEVSDRSKNSSQASAPATSDVVGSSPTCELVRARLGRWRLRVPSSSKS